MGYGKNELGLYTVYYRLYTKNIINHQKNYIYNHTLIQLHKHEQFNNYLAIE